MMDTDEREADAMRAGRDILAKIDMKAVDQTGETEMMTTIGNVDGLEVLATTPSVVTVTATLDIDRESPVLQIRETARIENP